MIPILGIRMAFFGNDAVNRVNIHYAIQCAGAGLRRHAGLRFPAARGRIDPGDFRLARRHAGRPFRVRPLILPLGKRWGLKPLRDRRCAAQRRPVPTYAAVHGLGWPLLLNGALGAVASTLYWPAYHAYFASVGDAEHRGHQVGAARRSPR